MNVSRLVHHPWVQGTAFFLGINALSRLGGGNEREIYASLDKPPWAPPSWLFGPVWSGVGSGSGSCSASRPRRPGSCSPPPSPATSPTTTAMS
jgi:hypothetical protein